MKKLALLLVIVLLSISLFSHPAKDVSASFDKETNILTVKYEHPVKNKDKHFIFEVKVLFSKFSNKTV